MLHILPAAIMFIFTVGFASVFLIPATSFTPKNTVVGFYWNGIWASLSAICAIAGAGQTLKLIGTPTMAVEETLLRIMLTTLIVFVVFGWFRLAGKAALHGVQKAIRKNLNRA